MLSEKQEKFKAFLLSNGNTPKATDKYISYLLQVEKKYGVSIDDIVSNDNKMFEVLKAVSANDHHGSIQYAMRRYYFYINSYDFPDLNQYRH